MEPPAGTGAPRGLEGEQEPVLGLPEIRNHQALLTRGMRGPRSVALRLAGRGLIACDPAGAVERIVALQGSTLTVAGVPYGLDRETRIVVLGSGKASLAIVAALERVLGEWLAGGMVVVRDLGGPPLRRTRVAEAAHPIPDHRSHAAARVLLDEAQKLGERDLLIACFTGGSSALTSLPPAGVKDEEKQELHRLLLSAGLSITDVNTVRKQVSLIKGGRLARAAAPARVINLTVSDAAGDALDVITAPTVPNTSTAEDAISVLREHRLWDEVPASIREVLADPEREQPDLGGVSIQTELLVTGEAACKAMSAEAALAGFTPVVLGTGLEEDAAALGHIVGQIAAESAALGRPFPPPSVLLACGGEATVQLAAGEQFGRGGPNREAALAAARRIAGHEVAAAFLDTDGSDGGGELAGAVVDGDTAARAAAAGLDLRTALATHGSGEVVAALEDGIETGPTHTNVNDLFAIAIGGGEDGA